MTETARYDLVAPFAFGYFSPFWFGNLAGPSHPDVGRIAEHGGIFRIFELDGDISAGVFENGYIVFDFSRCKLTPIVVHRESLWNRVQPNEQGRLTDQSVSKRLSRAESRQRRNQSYYRTILIAHALLLENAGRQRSGISFSLPRIERLSDAIGSWGIQKVMPRGPVFKVSHNFNVQALEKSFGDLNLALASGLNVLRALELHKLSHYRTLDHRFAESLVLSWTVCENIIDYVWRGMIQKIKLEDSRRMTKSRLETLSNSSNFTASIRVETLELSGLLTFQQAESLNQVRRTRNKWLHSLEDVDETSSLEAIKACAHLIGAVFKIELCDTIVSGAGGEGGGVPTHIFSSIRPDIDLNDVFDG
jgi:hypothetical protein